jgi:transposase
LAGYLTFLEQLEEDIARFKTRLEHIDEPQLRRIVTSDIKRLKARSRPDTSHCQASSSP